MGYHTYTHMNCWKQRSGIDSGRSFA